MTVARRQKTLVTKYCVAAHAFVHPFRTSHPLQPPESGQTEIHLLSQILYKYLIFHELRQGLQQLEICLGENQTSKGACASGKRDNRRYDRVTMSRRVLR